MKYKIPLAVALIILLIVGLGFTYLLTLGNARWRVERAFPGADISITPFNTRSIKAQLMVKLVPSFVSVERLFYVEVSHAPYTINLEERLAMLGELDFENLQFRKCKIIELYNDIEKGSFPPTFFRECDLTRLSAAEMKYLKFNNNGVFGPDYYSLRPSVNKGISNP